MLFEATTIVIFVLIGVAAVALGHFTQRPELYFLGVLLIFFMGLVMLSDGLAVKTGVVTNSTSTPSGNDTIVSTVESYQYDQTKDVFTNALGLLCAVIGAGLALTWFYHRKKEQERKAQGVDLDDD